MGLHGCPREGRYLVHHLVLYGRTARPVPVSASSDGDYITQSGGWMTDMQEFPLKRSPIGDCLLSLTQPDVELKIIFCRRPPVASDCATGRVDQFCHNRPLYVIIDVTIVNLGPNPCLKVPRRTCVTCCLSVDIEIVTGEGPKTTTKPFSMRRESETQRWWQPGRCRGIPW